VSHCTFKLSQEGDDKDLNEECEVDGIVHGRLKVRRLETSELRHRIAISEEGMVCKEGGTNEEPMRSDDEVDNAVRVASARGIRKDQCHLSQYQHYNHDDGNLLQVYAVVNALNKVNAEEVHRDAGILVQEELQRRGSIQGPSVSMRKEKERHDTIVSISNYNTRKRGFCALITP